MNLIRIFLVMLFGTAAVLLSPAYVQAEEYKINTWGSSGTEIGNFSNPSGVAVDSSGNVYVADTKNHRIQKFTSTGEYLTQWGFKGSESGNFSYPYSVAVDSVGNVYVTDTDNHRIQKFTSTGSYLTQWGTRGNIRGQFQSPIEIALDSADNVYVTDNGNYRIQMFTSTGSFLTKWGIHGFGNGEFSYAAGIALDSADNVYIADASRIQKFTSTGGYLTQWGDYRSGSEMFIGPYGIAVDKTGNVYVTERRNHRIQKFNSTGGYLTRWGSCGTNIGEFNSPMGITITKDNDIYIADRDNHRIQKFTKILRTIIPSSASNLGDAQVLINGDLFIKGSMVALVNGNYSIPGTVSYLDNTSIYGTFPLSGAPTQIYTLKLIQPDGKNYTLSDCFTITNNTAFITNISPSSGNNSQNQEIKITGTGFRADLKASLTKGNRVIEGIVLNRTNTQVIISFPLKDAYPGLYSLCIRNSDGTSDIRTNAFTVLLAGPAPMITSFTPASGPNTLPIPFTINGIRFRNGVTVAISNGTTIRTVPGTLTLDSKVTCLLPLTGLPIRYYNLTIRNIDGSYETRENAFAVTAPAPTITSISPLAGYNTTIIPITITGKTFISGCTVSLVNGSTIISGTKSQATATKMTGTFSLIGVPSGIYNLTVTNPGGLQSTKSFTVAPPNSSPTISTVTPDSGINTAALTVTIYGSSFRPGVTVNITNSTNSRIVAATVVNDTQIKCIFPLTIFPYGLYNLTVRNLDGSNCTMIHAFTVMNPLPVITKITPDSGYMGSTVQITVNGKQFSSGVATSLVNGTDRIIGNISGYAQSSFRVIFDLNGATEGTWNLTVTNPGTQNAVQKFTITAPGSKPVIKNITPFSGENSAPLLL